MFKIFSKRISESFIPQITKFMIVGAIGTIINLSILFIFTEFFNFYYIYSAIIAFFTSVINNYILNKLWTFQEKIQERIISKYIKYTLICLISLIVNLFILFILVEFYGIWYILSELIAIMGSFLVNFIGNKFLTFKKTDTN